MNLKRYLIMPLETAPLLMAGLLALIMSLTLVGGLTSLAFSIPVALVFGSWFFKYCYALLDAMAAGDTEPPVLSYEMINPLNEQRPLAQLGIVALCAWSTWIIWRISPVAGVAAAVLLLAALPATIAVLSLGQSWLLALWPPALLQVIRGMGWVYLLVLGITLGAAVLIAVLVLRYLQSLFILILLSELALLLVFSVIGGSIFERRVELGFDTLSKDERRDNRDRRDFEIERGRMLDQAYATLRLKRRRDAWELIQSWLGTHARGDDALSEYHTLLGATSGWEDPAIANRLASDYLDRLLAVGETGMALDVLAARLGAQPDFRPSAPATTVRLTELARLAGRAALGRQLEANAKTPGPGAL